MKKLTLYSNTRRALMALSMLTASACQTDLLDPAPQTSLYESVVFDSPERIAQQVDGLYAGLKSGQFLGGRFFVYGDIRADNFLNQNTNGVTGYDTWRHTEVSSTNEVNGLWTAAFATINRANLLLDGLDKFASKFSPPTFPADFANVVALQYKAEARFVRALCYHNLLQFYARPYADGSGARPGLPLRLTGETGAANSDVERSPVADVYAQILEDLNFAEANLPITYSGSTADYLRVARAHRNAAIALKTRVYLYMGMYGNVITEANKIVSPVAPFTSSTGVAHRLDNSFPAIFTRPYLSLESIFSMPFTESNLPGTQNGLGSYYNPGPAGAGDYTLNPAGIWGDLINWPATDARRSMTSTTSGRVYLRKFPSGPQHTDYAPVIRYSEVLLNLSEAIARTTGGVDSRALALLNAVRKRSDANVTLAPITNAALISAIMTERNIEFLGEGHRTSDITRQLLPIPGKSFITAIPATASIYIWPIPITELNANKQMTPNE